MSTLTDRTETKIVARAPSALTPHPGNPRLHKPKQVRQIADSIKRFGFTNPILTDSEGNVLAGHGRLEAAKMLGLASVPTICLDHLSPAERRAYLIADNKLADNSRFEKALLADMLVSIQIEEPTFDLEITGFALDEVDLLLDVGAPTPKEDPPAPPPNRARPALCRSGDLWILGRHRLLCGNALERDSYLRVMGRERARMIFCDPPFNVPASAISGKGRVKHSDFAMAAGEMSEPEFIALLITACTLMAKASVDGALHYVCMDWRHIFELLTAGRAAYNRLIDICVWAKGQPGMGAPYRSQHELIAVFKRGSRAHVDNVELGRHGRNRSNLWSYTSGPSFSATRQEELGWHATVKPVQLVADALLDASRADDLVLDGFAGSGTTLIAAEQTGRRARVIEIDPYYCEVILRRFEGLTGMRAVAEDGSTLIDRAAGRDADERGGGQ